MSKQNIISIPQVADPKDIKKGIISALTSIFVLMILLFFITYQIADPPAQDVIVIAEAEINEILLKDLKIESGSIGGGSASNDPIDKPKEQVQEVITGKSKRSSTKTGKSNKTNGNDASNEASTTVQSQDPFGSGGSGGSGGKNGGGNGPFSGPGNSDDGDEGLGKGSGASRLRINNASLPQYDIDYTSNVHLQLTINANGDIVAAKCIKSKTTCSDQRIINQVINEVTRQVKYKKEIGAGLAYTFYTIKILAK
jgi:hypothetical protein